MRHQPHEGKHIGIVDAPEVRVPLRQFRRIVIELVRQRFHLKNRAFHALDTAEIVQGAEQQHLRGGQPVELVAFQQLQVALDLRLDDFVLGLGFLHIGDQGQNDDLTVHRNFLLNRGLPLKFRLRQENGILFKGLVDGHRVL